MAQAESLITNRFTLLDGQKEELARKHCLQYLGLLYYRRILLFVHHLRMEFCDLALECVPAHGIW